MGLHLVLLIWVRIARPIYFNLAGGSKRMTKKRQAAKQAGPEVAFDPLEAALRQMFDDVASEKIPDDFADLVAKLENAARPVEQK